MAGWRIGLWWVTATWSNALARIKSYHDYGSFTPIQVASIGLLSRAPGCIEEIACNTSGGAECSRKACYEAGWMARGAEGIDVHLGRDPSRTGSWVALVRQGRCSRRRRSRCRRASGSVITATRTCASR